MSYKNESSFGKEFDLGMIKEGWDIHNIQTPTTERGCPDRFAQNRIGIWVELKNIFKSVNTPEVYIPYRPGQQSWLYKHWQHGGLSFTAIAGDDGILIIKNQGILKDKIYQQGKWPQLNVSHLYSRTISDWFLVFGGIV